MHFKLILSLTERVFPSAWGLAIGSPVRSVFGASVHPFHGLPFKLSGGFPQAEALDDFRPRRMRHTFLVKFVLRFGAVFDSGVAWVEVAACTVQHR